MVERDLGSTYLMPQSKLYKPDNRVIIPKNASTPVARSTGVGVSVAYRSDWVGSKGSENYRVLENS